MVMFLKKVQHDGDVLEEAPACMAWCPPGNRMVLFLKKVQQAPNPIRV